MSLAAWLFLRILRVIPAGHGALRHGIANLYRPGNQAQSAVVALGVGVMFTLTVFLVQSALVRQIRGRKFLSGPQGAHRNLQEVFERLNRQFFDGLLGMPQLSWSRGMSRSMLGHFDPSHNAIVISRIFDQFLVPRYAVEYIVYHEMLHLKHPVKLRGSRRCVHSAEFQAEEKLFPHVAQANAFLKRL